MSYEATYAVKTSGLNGSLFYVLDAMAFFVNSETGACFPSTQAIAKMARLSPNVVRKNIQKLESLGYVESRQKRGGVRYFTLHLDKLPLGDFVPNGVSDVKGESFQKCNPSPFRSERGPLSEVKAESGINQVINQVSNQEGSTPVGAHTSSLESDPKKEKKPRKKATPLVQKPDGVDQQLWDDWMVVRKEKRAPLTETAWKDMVLETKKAGISLNESIRICCVRNWRGFKASWNWQGTYGSLTKAQSNPSTKGFAGEVKTDPSKPEEWGNRNDQNKNFLKMIQQQEKDSEELPF